METILSADFDRVGMAIDVLTRWLHEPRTVVSLITLLNSPTDLHRKVMALRGLGRLKEPSSLPVLITVLDDPEQSFLLRINAAQALGGFDKPEALEALRRAASDPDSNVARAANQAFQILRRSSANT